MNSVRWLWGVVDWASLPIVAAVAGILVWRKLHREFPFFFAYLLATEVAGIVCLAAQLRGPRAYFYAYWISDLVLGVLNVLVVYELFGLRLFTWFYRVRIYRYLFATVAAIILLGAWLSAMESADKYRRLIVQDRVFDFVIVAMLTFFVLLMMVMGREWTRYDFAIAFGLVIADAGALIASAMWVRTRYQQSTVQELAPFTYDIACLIWLFSFWSTKRVFNRRVPADLEPEMVQEARRWEAVLKAWIVPRKRTPRDTE